MDSQEKNKLQSLERQAQAQDRQVKDLAERLSVAEQQERDRIARMLHDDLQQVLHSIQLQLHIITEKGEFSNQAIQTVQDELKQAIEMTRDLSVEMSPPVLRNKGFTEALKWLRERFRKRHFFTVSLEVADDVPEIGRGVELLLFHVTRELLFNVVKHAGTREAEVSFRSNGESLQLEVHDKGKGFDQALVEEATPGTAGFGLSAVRERIGLFGGQVEINSQPGDGTSVVISIPFRIAKNAASMQA